jgi:hypothetical protein
MVSVLKNIGPILITILESWTDGKQISSGIWLSMAMLILGLSPPVPLPLPRFAAPLHLNPHSLVLVLQYQGDEQEIVTINAYSVCLGTC